MAARDAVAVNVVAAAVDRPPVIVLGPALDAVSGVSTHVRTLLGSSLAERFTFHHFQVGSEGRTESVAGRLMRILGSPFALAAAIRARRARIVHLNTSMNAAFLRDLAYAIVAKLCGARVFCQIHGGKLPQQVFPRSRVARLALRRALEVPDGLAVLAHAELDAYRSFVPGRSVVVAANAVPCPTEAARVHERSDGDVDAPLQLVFVGRLMREKGLCELLRALATLRDRGIDVVLLVAGTGPDERHVRQLASELRLSAVVFLGPIFGEAKTRLLAAADAFVLPSYSEGLPYAMLEAMALGVPVIATPVGAIRDVVIDGVHGRLVAPREPAALAAAIEELAADRRGLARMGAACRARIASTYSVEHLVRELDEQYSAICADRPRRVGANRRGV